MKYKIERIPNNSFLTISVIMFVLLGLLSCSSSRHLVKKLPDKHREFLSKVRFIISKQEKRDFLNLASEEEQQIFIKEFWKKRDPDPETETNEFKEAYFDRITKANKLLYYIDCYHLLEYGITVTNETYRKLPQGPVPEETYMRLNAAVELIHNFRTDREAGSEYKEPLQDYIDIEMEELPEPYDFRYRLTAKKEFDEKLFEGSELKIIKKPCT